MTTPARAKPVLEAVNGNRASSDTGRSAEPKLRLALYPERILRSVCQPVETFDSALRDFAAEMLTLLHWHRRTGLAAPQLGHRQRLIVCKLEEQPLVLVNPEVKDASESRDHVEGCLSLPDVRVNVRRPERIRVAGYDLRGRRRSFGAVGLWARVIQHGLDHLNGVMICDYTHPEAERCSHCLLEMPAILVEKRKQQSRAPQRR